MMPAVNTCPNAYRPRPGWLALSLLPIALQLPGCAADKKANPSFPLSINQAKLELRAMHEEPMALQRPVIVLGGWGDLLGLPPAKLAKQLRHATGDERIVSVGFGGCMTFDACRARLLDRIEQAFPSDDPGWTTEVDVIGFSMGGIVARYAAAPKPETDASEIKRLRIANLYTISTPHRGALMATIIAPGSLATDMRPGSGFMQSLDANLDADDYSVTPYARLYDLTVGEFNAAPHNENPYWVAPAPFTSPHRDAYKDPRIVADIARRLRGETPYTTEPASPLPQ